MEKKFINPPTIHPPRGYTHVVTAEGGRMVFVAGQVSYTKDLQFVGAGDLRAQARQAFQNLGSALAAAGASFADVVKMNTYVVNYKPSDMALIAEARREFLPKENPPASTLVGVQGLAVEGLLIEIEAIAVVR
jgi:enamine deaminase RidA (YjgF/YER057c/UK114 family)